MRSVCSGETDWAEQPRQTATSTRIDRRNNFTRNRLYIEGKEGLSHTG
jgi:hypothetical protein